MAEPVKSKIDKNLLAALIALIILVAVAGLYLDRRGQRSLDRYGTGTSAELLAEWGPGAGRAQRARAALGIRPVALTKVSYKNIIARVAPSVVSVNVETSGFIDQPNQAQLVAQNQAIQRGQGLYPWCPPGGGGQQPAGRSLDNMGTAQYVWGGRMGGWGMGPVGNLICPNCSTTVPHTRGVPAYAVGCPSCGVQMMRQGATGPYPGQGAGQIPQGQPMAQPQQNGFQFQAPTRGGSGVIVNRLGYVLTNHHVIHGAKSITVTLSSGKVTKTYPAQVVDEAPEFDFAILKIKTNGNEQFAAAPIGNSSVVSMGDEVLAIGSPFGLQQTATFGIISNTTRTLAVGNKKFKNFFQTDVAINPGSSGGPLVNVAGEVIAINTAIYSPTQAFSGIGFASPIDPAKAAFAEFMEFKSKAAVRTIAGQQPIQRGQGLYPWCPPGRAQQAAVADPRLRGQGLLPWCPPGGRLRQMANVGGPRVWLGMRAGEVGRSARTTLALPVSMTDGVLVMEVFGGSPCQLAGLRRGDVILRLDDRSIRDVAMFADFVSARNPGDELKLTVYRDGRKLDIPVMLVAGSVGLQGLAGANNGGEFIIQAQAVAFAGTEQAAFDPANAAPPGLKGVLAGGEVGAGEVEALGMGVEDLAPALTIAFEIPKSVRGVVITEVANQAEAAGLLAGDVIQAVNRRRVRSVADFIKVMNKASLQDGIAFDIYRQGQLFQVTMKG